MIRYGSDIIPFGSEYPLPSFYSRMSPTTLADNESPVIEQIGIEHSPSIRHDNIFLVIQIPETPGLSHFCKTSIRYRSRSEAFPHSLLFESKSCSFHTVLLELQRPCLLYLQENSSPKRHPATVDLATTHKQPEWLTIKHPLMGKLLEREFSFDDSHCFPMVTCCKCGSELLICCFFSRLRLRDRSLFL